MNELSNGPIGTILDEIPRDECIELLRTQSVGRLAVADHGHYPPHIVPVNFVVDDDAVVFRSDAGQKWRLAVLSEHSVSFEVDTIDREGHMAWSVVVEGRAQPLDADDIEGIRFAGGLEPWAAGDRSLWVRIVPYSITGRRLRRAPYAPQADQ